MSKRKRIVHANTPEGQLAGEAVLEAIKNQIRDNDPPETRLTLARLMKGGQSREDAMRLIGCAMAVEIFEIVKNSSSFDERRYVANLRRLPELPFEPSDEIMLRPALLEDIPAMHALRLGVRENRLSDPSKVTQADYERRLAQPDASWVAEVNGSIVGFAIADFPSRSVWALFMKPDFEGRGIGRSLLRQVTQSLEAAGAGTIHLSTEAGTRAERLYVAAGWTRCEQLPNGEIHFVRVVPSAV